MKKLIRNWILIVSLTIISVGGCVMSIGPDGEKQYNIDPNAVVKVERTAETAISIMTLLSPFFPWLIPIVVGGGAAYGTWKKIKPKLIEVQDEATLYHSIASSSVIALDGFKKKYPDEWNNLMERLEVTKDKIIKPEDRLKIDNLIRGLRGLPPKG